MTVIIFLFQDPNPEHAVYIMGVNIYVNVIFVLLATVWCSEHWHCTSYGPQGAQPRFPSMAIQTPSTVVFAPPTIHTSHTQLDVEMTKITE